MKRQLLTITIAIFRIIIAQAQPASVKNAAKSVFSLTTFRADGSLLASSHGIFIGDNGEAVSDLTPFIRVNRDIFLRTLCLVAVNLFFTSAGARQSTTILAVNTLLIQLYLLFSYIMDGFAYAGEALGGRFWGAGDMPAFHSTVRRLFGWGAIMTVLFTLIYVMGGMPFLRLLTDEPDVVKASHDYVLWAYLIPICGVAAFIWDGIFIGTTQTRGMLLSAALAAIVFFALSLGLISEMGNHGLWLAMVLYLFMRGGVQTVWFARMKTPDSHYHEHCCEGCQS